MNEGVIFKRFFNRAEGVQFPLENNYGMENLSAVIVDLERYIDTFIILYNLFIFL